MKLVQVPEEFAGTSFPCFVEAADDTPTLPVIADHTDGMPVVAIAFSAYQLSNLAAVCEVLQRYGAFNTGDWMICYRDRIPNAAKRYAAGILPNRSADDMDSALFTEMHAD